MEYFLPPVDSFSSSYSSTSATSSSGNILNVNWAPPWEGLPYLVPQELLEDYLKSYAKFASLVVAPEDTLHSKDNRINTFINDMSYGQDKFEKKKMF